MNGAGMRCISYGSSGDHQLRLADLAYGFRYAAGWHELTIDAEGDVGYDPSLVVDESGDSWLAYRNGQGHLGIARQHRGIWRLNDFPAGGDAVFNSNLDFDGSGRLGVALHHDESGRLSFGWIDEVGHSEGIGDIR